MGKYLPLAVRIGAFSVAFDGAERAPQALAALEFFRNAAKNFQECFC